MNKAQAGFWNTEAPEVLQQLQAPPDGLSSEEAGRRLAQYGPNLLKPPTRSGPLWLLLGQFKSPIILLLIHYVDVGTSGGVWGMERGYCLMIGGGKAVVRRLDPIWSALAPGIAAASRTPGRPKAGSTAEHGYLHCGLSGAGHFVKMVHNGIEYGLMAAYAEGLNILHSANVGKRQRTTDAETTPLRHPEYYQYDLNLADIAEVWRRGSVIASWLLDLTAASLLDSPDLAKFKGRVSDSGEGRWTIVAAIDESAPAPVISAALYDRFSSRGAADFADKVLSAMRHAFGGHTEKPAGPKRGVR